MVVESRGGIQVWQVLFVRCLSTQWFTALHVAYLARHHAGQCTCCRSLVAALRGQQHHLYPHATNLGV